MKRNYKYLWSLFPSVLIIGGNCAGGWWVAANSVFSLGILALLERFVTEDKSNDADEDVFFPSLILQLHVLLQLLILGSVIYSLRAFAYAPIQFMVMALSVGINTGASAIVIAHELIHRKNRYKQFLGKLLLLTACNIYFFIDHLRIHHKWVGTAKDHATARKGESVYRFFIRSVFGQIKSSWQLETQRLQHAGIIKKFFSNYLVASVVLIVLICIGFYLLCGWAGVSVFLLQAFFANFLLEYTNYIEHYGLSRQETQRVTELHSWQSDKVISRYFLIDLSRHADHHYYASKPYHMLKSYEKAPVLPGGYVEMIYYALIPPLWFNSVDKLLKVE